MTEIIDENGKHLKNSIDNVFMDSIDLFLQILFLGIPFAKVGPITRLHGFDDNRCENTIDNSG